MRAYILYSILPTLGGKVETRLEQITSYCFNLNSAVEHARAAKDRTAILWGGGIPRTVRHPKGVLRLPDDLEERRSVMLLAAPYTLLAAKTKYSQTAYMQLSPCGKEEPGAEYISGWFRTIKEAKESQTPGRLVLVLHKGTRIVLRGDKPKPPSADLWGISE